MYSLIVVGCSWGGLAALSTLLDRLPADVEVPMAIAQHRSPEAPEGGLASLLSDHTSRAVRDPGDKEPIEPRTVYIAPPDYHLLVERGYFSLSTDELVQFARPSIDVLFESAADAYGEGVIGVVLTGANNDGAHGLQRIKERGGVAIVQDPRTAARRAMPDAAIALTAADAVLPIEEIGPFVRGLCIEVAV